MAAKKSKYYSELCKKIPAAIRPLILDRHILSGEDQNQYDQLLAAMADLWQPTDIEQWFAVKKLCQLLWEDQRVSRFKAPIIGTAPKATIHRDTQRMFIRDVVSLANEYPEKYDRNYTRAEVKKVEARLRVIEVEAFVERIEALLLVDKMQMSNQAMQEMIRHRLTDMKTIVPLPAKDNDNEEGRQLGDGRMGTDQIGAADKAENADLSDQEQAETSEDGSADDTRRDDETPAEEDEGVGQEPDIGDEGTADDDETQTSGSSDPEEEAA